MSKTIEDRLAVLAKKTKAGDTRAYRELLRDATPMIRQNAYYHLSRFGQAQSSEDIVQETLLAVHQKFHTYDSAQPFLPWLRAIAHHKAIDYLRKNKVRTVSIEDDAVPDIEDPASHSETTAARDLDVLLRKLKPPSGEIIYQLKVEGSSVADLARKFNLSESNIKVLVHRGLARLAKLALATKAAAS